MKSLMIGVTLIALLTSPAAIARPDNNDRDHRSKRQMESRWDGHMNNGRHRGWGHDRGRNARWGRGDQMGYNDWRNAERVDYRRYKLRPPPRGYEWRRNDDRFILAAVTTGVIMSVILMNGR